MLSEDQKVFKITAAGTKNVLDGAGYLLAIIVSAAAAGLVITIQDKASTPNKLLANVDLTLLGTPALDTPLVRDYRPPEPVRMEGGIDIVTTGTGEAYVWVFYLFEPDPQT